jgi:hypothetical protein
MTPLIPRLLPLVLVVFAVTAAHAQVPTQPTPQPPKPKPSVQKLGPTKYRIGQVEVDTEKREVVTPATINDVTVLEFVANTAGGFKAYESALTVHTDAISYNAALLLIGLDPSRAKVPTMHFDPKPPVGDPVEVLVEWTAGAGTKRVAIEDLLFDRRTNTTLPNGAWVYTGSTFYDDGQGQGKKFLAEMDGVLIGFVHSPAPLIENPREGAVNGYGAVVLNPNLGLKAGQAVTLIVRALPLPKPQR